MQWLHVLLATLAEAAAAETARAARMVARSTREGIAASDDEVAGADLGETEAHERYRQAIERARNPAR